MSISCIIVDDEPYAGNLLEEYILQVPYLRLEKKCLTVMEALDFLQRQVVDLVFLDINLPQLSGMQLAHILPRNQKVIFTTAYTSYAVESYAINAIDYLLKPIDVEELKSAVKKVEEKRLGKISGRLRMLQDNLRGQTNSHKIALPATDGLVFIPVNQILYCEASSNYTVFHTMDKKQYVVCKTLKEYEELLMAYNFFRIHHSYLVNLDEIKKYVKGEGGHVVLNNNVSLDVSKRKKADFLNRLNDKAS